jgi:hypothetical protein
MPMTIEDLANNPDRRKMDEIIMTTLIVLKFIKVRSITVGKTSTRVRFRISISCSAYQSATGSYHLVSNGKTEKYFVSFC